MQKRFLFNSKSLDITKKKEKPKNNLALTAALVSFLCNKRRNNKMLTCSTHQNQNLKSFKIKQAVLNNSSKPKFEIIGKANI